MSWQEIMGSQWYGGLKMKPQEMDVDAVRPKMALVWLAHWYTNFEVLTSWIEEFPEAFANSGTMVTMVVSNLAWNL
jgi:hypothetical protein